MKKCLIVHGIGGSSSENWFPWLKSELEAKGWEVFVPDLPNSDHPNVEQWNKTLVEITKDFDEESVIVGHSMGFPAGLNLVQSLNKKIGKIIAVAPVNPRQPFADMEKSMPNLDWEAVKSFANINFNWQKIQDLAKIIVWYSDNDPYIPAESVNYYKENFSNAEFKSFTGKGHFNKSAGVTEFPELLEEIIK